MNRAQKRDSHFSLGRISGPLESYRHGSILYMYFENFVTYDHCEIYPGPHMNMVMGPNGSGKSSIVAAMAIGLGWPPSVLGRSKDVTEFIKYNTERAVLEIILRVDPECDRDVLDDEGDVVKSFDWDEIGVDAPDGFICIRREIFRGRAKQSEWRLNGKPTLAKYVDKLVKWFNIQINNLCQFLPQDRVSDFAKMTPVELLMETEKAAASVEVAQLHQKLIDNRAIVRDSQSQVNSESARLESLVKQATSLDEALERHREYQEHLKVISNCERKRPWLEYNEAREDYLKKKDAKEKAKKEFDEKIGHTEPLKKKLAELAAKNKQFKSSYASDSSKLDKRQKLVENLCGKEIADLETKIQAKRNEFYSIKKQKEKKRAEIVELRQSIRELEEEVNNAPSNENEERAVRDELGNLVRQSAEVDKMIQEVEGNKAVVQRDVGHLHQELEALSNQLAQLDNVKAQRLRMMGRYQGHVVDAYNWYQEHKDEFRTKIYGPIIVDMDVPSTGVAPLIEDSIGQNIQMSFVSTNDQDTERFLSRLEREKNIRVNMITIDMSVPSNYRMGEEISRDLKVCGFEKMAIEYVQAPEPILRALIENGHLDKVPIAPKGLLRPLHSIPDASLHGIHKLITNEDRFEIKRSRYSSEPVIKSSNIRRGELLSQSFNQNAKAQLQSRMDAIRERQKEFEVRMHQLLLEQEPHKNQLQQLSQRQSVLHDRRTELLNASRRIKVVRGKLERDKQRLRDVADSLNELQEEPIKEELKVLFRERKSKTLKIMGMLKEYKESLAEILEGHVEYMLQMAEVTKLEAQISEMERQHEDLKILLNQAEREFQAAKDNAKRLLSKANETPIDEELRLIFSKLPETLSQLDRLIAEEQSRAEMLQGGTYGEKAVNDLQSLRHEIASLENHLHDSRHSIKMRQEEIDADKSIWLPCVERMIEKINANFAKFFSSLKCVGEVRLCPKGDDFDQWEVDILVQFRDDERLQRLTAQRQSGGEKSVSTILYLLALQELSNSPFRVVDEINQGMDATNERKVHSLIVETATDSKQKSQYFLITPKLLTDLKYHENMHVLCVFNGSGMPVPEVWDDTAGINYQEDHFGMMAVC